MKKVLRMLGQALVIVMMTLAVDFTLLATVFSGMKRSWADAGTAYTEAYILTDYDHDLAPNAKSHRAWGNIVHSWQTDRYGFRIGDCAPGEAEKDRLFGYKENVWKSFHYSQAYLESMKSQAFWDAEFDRIPGIDAALLQARRP